MSKMSVLSVVAVVAALMAEVSPVSARTGSSHCQVMVDANNVWIRAGESPVAALSLWRCPVQTVCQGAVHAERAECPARCSAGPPASSRSDVCSRCQRCEFLGGKPPPAGRQTIPVNSVAITIDKDEADSSARFFAPPADWLSQAGDTSELLEARTIAACHVKRLGATVITWQSELANVRAGQSVVLSGSHYFGLGMRFVRAMDGASSSTPTARRVRFFAAKRSSFVELVCIHSHHRWEAGDRGHARTSQKPPPSDDMVHDGQTLCLPVRDSESP